MVAPFLRRSYKEQRNFRHLLVKPGPTRYPVPRPLKPVPIKFVHPHDRVALWNIEPNDQVYVRSGKQKGLVCTVESVARHSGQVYLRGGIGRKQLMATRERGASLTGKSQPQKINTPGSTHVSNLCLVLPQVSEEGRTLVVTRMKATRLRYSDKKHTFIWRRKPLAVRELLGTGQRASEEAGKIRLGDAVSIPVNDLARKKNETATERDESADHVALWHAQMKRKEKPYVVGPSKTFASADEAAADTFHPSFSSLSSLTSPELTIPSTEFSGGPSSRARQTDAWNAKNRTADWRIIPRLPKLRKLAKVNWSQGITRKDLPLSSIQQTSIGGSGPVG